MNPMTKLAQKIRSLFSNAPEAAKEATIEFEHEVYLANRWDPATDHSPSLFTGTLEECEQFQASDPRPNCQRSVVRIRPTGEVLERTS